MPEQRRQHEELPGVSGKRAVGGKPPARPAKGIYRRNLPHLQPDDRAFFVTFATFRRMPLPPEAREVVLRHCLHDHKVKVWLHGVVVMPDHVHMVMTPLRDGGGQIYGLAEILGGIKGTSAHAVDRILHRRGHVWQDESFDHVLRSHESVAEKVDYICANPVRAGLTQQAGDYAWLWRDPEADGL